MKELIKIKDVSAQYDISARTLRYYEDMGLIGSTRSDDYAFRMYDELAVKRLEQILILRKLNISIRDIQRIFNSSGSETVLEVLGKKVDDIDGEVALLHELKDIVLEFIRQIKRADFNREADVKLLYAKAKEIESQLINVDYNGNPSHVNRLLDVTDKLKKTPKYMLLNYQSSEPFHRAMTRLTTYSVKADLTNGWEPTTIWRKKSSLIAPTLCGTRKAKRFGYGRSGME